MNSGNHLIPKFQLKLTNSWHRFFGLLLLMAVLVFTQRGIAIAQTADFVIRPAEGNYCAPSLIKFVPTFSETPLTYYWQTGVSDEESSELSPSVTYTVPGTYKVTLVVLFSNKLVEVTYPVTIVGSPVITLKPDRNSICQPGNVTFTLSSSSRLKSTTWDFGDNSNTMLPEGQQKVTHLYNEYGSFPVSVSGVDHSGCTGYGSFNFDVKQLSAELIDTPTIGCLPVEVRFGAKVTVPEGSAVTSYLWDFNDGSSKVSTTVNEIRHTYTVSDTLIPSLTITTAEGCTNSFFFHPLAFGMQPSPPVLSVNKPVGCASEIMYFTAAGAKANKFYWILGDGSIFTSGLEMSTQDSVLEYEFESLGEFTMQVVAENNGCRSELSNPVDVSIKGVVADFAFSNSCTERNRFNFRNTSDGTVNRVRWTFIDSSNTSSQPRPAFIFPKQGSFPVTMIVTENASGCSDTTTSIIYTALPRFLPSDSFVCLGNNLALGVSDSYSSANATYIWTVGGKNYPPNSSSNFSAPLTNPGLFTNRVIINNGTGYCRDTLIQPVKVKVSGPSADFKSSASVCQSEMVVLFDSSTTAFQSDPLVSWNWDFGNGITSTDKNPQPVKYESSGIYNISLTVEDTDGCTNTITQRLKVNRQPLLRIVPRSQKVCQGQEITLLALHKNPVTWSTAGMNSCDTCSVIRVKPMAPAKILVKSTDGNGCTSRDSINLDVWMSFELPNGVLRDTSICIGNSVPLDLKIAGKLINWQPAAGLSSYIISNPIAKPDVTTRYTAVVTDTGRCFTRTASALIEVNPIPEIDPGPDFVLPYNTPFTIKPVYSTSIASYNWQPANLLSCTNCAEPSGKATVSSLFTVNVVSDKGCKSSARIRLTIDCSEKNLLMPTAFSPNNDGLNDYFYPLTRGVTNIRRFIIYNRLGELVFEKRDFKPNDKSQGWNGMFRGKVQPVGSFVYFVEAECDLGNTLSTKGNVMLMR